LTFTGIVVNSRPATQSPPGRLAGCELIVVEAVKEPASARCERMLTILSAMTPRPTQRFIPTTIEAMSPFAHTRDQTTQQFS